MRIISPRSLNNNTTTFNVYREVLEGCERSETLARQRLGTIYILYYFRKSDLLPSAEFFTRDPDNARRLFSTYKNQTCCRLLSFFTRDPDNARRLFSTHLITDLKKASREKLYELSKEGPVLLLLYRR
eukprot:sb/3475395/